MKIDIHRVESKRNEREKAMARVSKSLDSVLARFKQALKYRKKRRENLFDQAEKVAKRRAETVKILKEVIIKLDRTKSILVNESMKLAETEKNESLLKAKYEELLNGHMPADSGNVDETPRDNGHDLASRKEEYLSKINDAFAELDREIVENRRQKGELPAILEKRKTTVDYYERKSKILKKTLKMYRNELVGYDREIADTVEEEELLLQEYTDFSERLGAVVSIPASMEKLLEKNLEKANGKQSVSSN